MSDLLLAKQAVRAAVRARLAEQNSEHRAHASSALCQRLLARPEWVAASTVLLFHPLPDEPDLRALWRHAGPRRLCLPRVEGDRLRLHHVPVLAELSLGAFGVAEPVEARHPEVALAEVDLALVPGVAFTQEGARLGRGKGFYDRLLSDPAFRGRALGICFAEQLVRSIPVGPHDRWVHAVLA